MTDDTCQNAPCTRTRRWGSTDNVKRWCEECTRDVMRDGRPRSLDTGEIVKTAATAAAEPKRPIRAGRMVQ